MDDMDFDCTKWKHHQRTVLPKVGVDLPTTSTSTILSEDVPSPPTADSTRCRGYINQFSDCASLYSTTMTSITVITASTDSPIIGYAPPGTAVLSAVHILYQSSDLSILPTAVSVPESTSQSTPNSVDGVPATTSGLTSTDGPVGGSGGGTGISKGAIAGIVVGSVAGVFFLGAIAWYVWRLRRQLSSVKKGDGDGDKPGELHGEGVKKHELLTEEKPAEAVGSDPAVELPIDGHEEREVVQKSAQPVEMQG